MDNNNNPYIFWIVGLIVGVAACAGGIRTMLNDEAILVIGEDATNTLTGIEAFWCGAIWLCFGVALLGLMLVGPRALETRSKRGSYSSPQTISLIACVGLLVFAICSMVAQHIYVIGK